MDGLKDLPLKDISQGLPVPNGQQGREDEAKKSQEEQMRRDVMSTVLDTGARARLSRIALVSPERSRQIESIILHMVQSGQLRVSETQLIELLEQMEGQGSKTASKTTIVYQRRRDIDDEFDF